MIGGPSCSATELENRTALKQEDENHLNDDDDDDYNNNNNNNNNRSNSKVTITKSKET